MKGESRKQDESYLDAFGQPVADALLPPDADLGDVGDAAILLVALLILMLPVAFATWCLLQLLVATGMVSPPVRRILSVRGAVGLTVAVAFFSASPFLGYVLSAVGGPWLGLVAAAACWIGVPLLIDYLFVGGLAMAVPRDPRTWRGGLMFGIASWMSAVSILSVAAFAAAASETATAMVVVLAVLVVLPMLVVGCRSWTRASRLADESMATGWITRREIVAERLGRTA